MDHIAILMMDNIAIKIMDLHAILPLEITVHMQVTDRLLNLVNIAFQMIPLIAIQIVDKCAIILGKIYGAIHKIILIVASLKIKYHVSTFLIQLINRLALETVLN